MRFISQYYIKTCTKINGEQIFLNIRNNKNGFFVIPGNQLCVIEEFLPGKWTYEEDGNIYSSTTGVLQTDISTKTISVFPSVEEPVYPTIGSSVLGKITTIQNTNLEMRIYFVDGREISGFFSGLLHVSNVSRAYVKNMFNFFEKSDIVKATVISTTNNVFHLSTAKNELGVILSTCPYCRDPLKKINGRLVCQSCNRRHKKKLSSDYGKDVSNLIKPN